MLSQARAHLVQTRLVLVLLSPAMLTTVLNGCKAEPTPRAENKKTPPVPDLRPSATTKVRPAPSFHPSESPSHLHFPGPYRLLQSEADWTHAGGRGQAPDFSHESILLVRVRNNLPPSEQAPRYYSERHQTMVLLNTRAHPPGDTLNTHIEAFHIPRDGGPIRAIGYEVL